MNWYVWRKYRWEAIACIAVLILVAALTIPAGRYFRALPADFAAGVISTIFDQPLFFLPNVIAFLVGMFAGVPLLSQEFEWGSIRLSVTQGLTRSEWLRQILLRVAVFAAVFYGLLTLVVNWWLAPVTPVLGPMVTITAVGFAVFFHSIFLLLLGIGAGLWMRKIVPGMVVYIPLALLSFAFFLLPLELLPTETVTWNYTGNDPTGSMEILARQGDRIVDAHGHTVNYEVVMEHCPPVVISMVNAGDGKKLIEDRYECLRSQGYANRIEYHPMSSYWLLQGMSSVIFVLLSIAVVSLMRHRFLGMIL